MLDQLINELREVTLYNFNAVFDDSIIDFREKEVITDRLMKVYRKRAERYLEQRTSHTELAVDLPTAEALIEVFELEHSRTGDIKGAILFTEASYADLYEPDEIFEVFGELPRLDGNSILTHIRRREFQPAMNLIQSLDVSLSSVRDAILGNPVPGQN